MTNTTSLSKNAAPATHAESHFDRKGLVQMILLGLLLIGLMVLGSPLPGTMCSRRQARGTWPARNRIGER